MKVNARNPQRNRVGRSLHRRTILGNLSPIWILVPRALEPPSPNPLWLVGHSRWSSLTFWRRHLFFRDVRSTLSSYLCSVFQKGVSKLTWGRIATIFRSVMRFLRSSSIRRGCKMMSPSHKVLKICWPNRILPLPATQRWWIQSSMLTIELMDHSEAHLLNLFIWITRLKMLLRKKRSNRQRLLLLLLSAGRSTSACRCCGCSAAQQAAAQQQQAAAAAQQQHVGAGHYAEAQRMQNGAQRQRRNFNQMNGGGNTVRMGSMVNGPAEIFEMRKLSF